MHELRKDSWKENVRNCSYGVRRDISETIIIEVQIAKEIVLKIIVKVYAISKRSEKGTWIGVVKGGKIEEQMDEWMFFAETIILANPSNIIPQIFTFQGNSRSQKLLYPKMQIIGLKQGLVAWRTAQDNHFVVR